MELEARLGQIEDAIRQLALARALADGRAFAYQLALQGLLKFAAPVPGAFESVVSSLDMASTIALNSQEPQPKVDATDAAVQEILLLVNQAVEAHKSGKK